MSFTSQQGQVGIKIQSVKGTYKDPGAVAPNQGVFIRTRSGALGGNRELMIPDPEIGGNRDIPDANLGPISYSGEYDMYLRMESLATILTACLGGVVDSGTVPLGYTHTITPVETTLPWVSVEEKVGSGFEVFKYTDCKVNTFHMEADANGYLMGTMGLIGLTQQETTATAVGVARVDTSSLLVGTSILVAWNGANLPAKSFSLDINNNIEDDDFRLGSLFLGDAVEKRREITMGVTIRPQDNALWKTAMWGGPSATVPGGQSFKDDMTITITSYEDIPGSTGPTVKYSAVFTIPQAIIAPYTPTPSGDDVMDNDLEIHLVRPAPATPIMTVVVKNSYATAA
jgi:hypothetical protein